MLPLSEPDIRQYSDVESSKEHSEESGTNIGDSIPDTHTFQQINISTECKESTCGKNERIRKSNLLRKDCGARDHQENQHHEHPQRSHAIARQQFQEIADQTVPNAIAVIACSRLILAEEILPSLFYNTAR